MGLSPGVHRRVSRLGRASKQNRADRRSIGYKTKDLRCVQSPCPRNSYYVCEPSKNLGPKAEQLLPDHPRSIWVREEALVEGVLFPR